MKSPKSIIKQSYDSHAGVYTSRKLLQTKNLKRLLSYLMEHDDVPNDGTVLDIGCGDGVLLDVIGDFAKSFPYQYLGVDLSSGMIDAAKQNHGDAFRFRVGDAEELGVPPNSINIAVSNSVLHWLNIPELDLTPEKAISEAFRALSPAGLFAASIAGEGTAERFLSSYRLVRGRRQNKDPFREDPIGSMRLHDVVDLFLKSGFAVELAHLEYEPIEYPTPRHYADHVKAYGYEMFVNGVPETEKEDTWEQIVRRFEEDCGSERYVHDQYMIYIIGRKRT